MGLTL